MTIRNLEALFHPRSIALIGASRKPSTVGAVLAHNLLAGGFDGPVMPVNPRHDTVESVIAYPDVASLPIAPDLAVIATPTETVPGLVAELAGRGTRAAIVISAGFGEMRDERGPGLQQAVLDAARPALLRVVGPNCLGVMSPSSGVNASFAHVAPQPGRVAFVTQSGAIVTSMLDWAHERGIGFSRLVSLGDMVDVDFGDMLDYLANDADTHAILLYIEGVTSARKFLSAARAASRSKPVVVVKGGRFAEGARAVSSHTGALAGVDAVYDAVFRRAGMLRVHSLTELFAAVETLAMTCRPKGDRLTILTNGGGIGVLATDALIEEGGRLAELSEATLQRLDGVLPPAWSHGNPVDVIGDATGPRYAGALEAILEDPGTDAVLALHCPTAVASGTEAAHALVESAEARRCTHLLTSWVGDGSAEEARRTFIAHSIPTYDSPEQAVRAFMYLVNYRRGQELLMETPASVPEDFSPDVERAQRLIARVLEEQRRWLTEPEAKEVLGAYGVPTVATRTAPTPELAASIAAELGGLVALKIVSPDLLHKSDVGGVVLDLAGPAAVQRAAEAMAADIGVAYPEARLEGFAVQPMVRRPGAYELLVGATEDPQFGPVILFGHGGTAVEVIDDKALGLPPLNMRLAHEVISRTRIFRQLRGFRDHPAVHLDAVAMTLLKVSQLMIDLPEVQELDINPLLADAYGVMALDARIGVARAERLGAERLAIRPYPKELEETIVLGDGRPLLLRPIRPEDEPSLQATFATLDPEEIRLRFFVPIRTLTHVTAARFTQIDYDREMALVLTEPGIPGRTRIYGVVSIISDPDNERGEYAIIIHHDLTGLGLGPALMRRMMDYARWRGLHEIHGDVLRENKIMLKLCTAFGFQQRNIPGDPGVVRVVATL
ncbi:MAG TPA: bifunctional acetate--CoA ligase family protein/GNAT family N-acetyltransferase [bacterium]|nr:bifunctional acetate--CoA ligase family protein/GNAT family N-acetyltransferase [bacterium]